jgi:predicted PurR-regulated permease PerM
MNGAGQASRNFFVVLTIILVVAAMRLAQDILVPIALALLLTILLAPVVDHLQRLGMNRHLAVFITVIVACTVLGGLLYVVFDQLRELAHALPQYRRQLTHNIASLSGVLRGGVGRVMSLFEELGGELHKLTPSPGERNPIPKVEVVESPLNGVQAIQQVFGPLLAPLATIAIVLVFVIFMLLRFADLRDRLIRMLGSRNLRVATEALDDAARRVSRYLLMQTLINAWEGLCIAVGLTFIGVPNAVLWGALTMVLRFIPYLGILVAAGMPLVVCFAVFDHWTPPLLTLGLFVAVELVSYVVLEPWLYSRRTGVSPVALLVAAAFWAWLWGAAGLFLAIPLTVCLVVMGKYIPQLAFLNVLLGDQPVLAPHERLYQRLLASNSEDADDLLELSLREHPLLEVCDRVVLPTLVLIERDHEHGALRDSKRQQVLDHLERWVEELTESVEHAAASAGEASSGDLVRDTERALGRSLPSAAVLDVDGKAADSRKGVLCLPAADRADEIAAKLLALVLREGGFQASAVPRAHERLGEGPAPAVVVVSALPLDALAHARHITRRARLHLRALSVVVGLWGASGELAQGWQRLESAGASRLATSFATAAAQVESLTARIEEGPQEPQAPKPPLPAPPAHA